MLSLKPSQVSCHTTESGVESWETVFPQPEIARSKTGEADDPISLNSKRCPWMVPVQDKPLLSVNYAEYLLLFRRAARKPAGSENSRTHEIQTEMRTLEDVEICTTPRKERTCQPELVKARSTCLGNFEHCNNLLPSVLLHGHASPTPPGLLRFSSGTNLQRKQCTRLDPFSDENTVYRQEFKVCCASWQVVGHFAKCDTTLRAASLDFF